MEEAEIQRIKAVKEKWTQALISIPGVVSVGITNKAILIRVKDPETARKIPKEIDGIPVKVEIGKIVLFQDTYTQRVRPVLGGYSLGAVNITAGTFSCMVKDNLTGKILGLTNAHVLATKYGTWPGNPPGTPVLQPGPYDGGKEETDTVGYVLKGYPVEPPPAVNPIDAALFTPTSPTILSDKVVDVGKPLTPVEPKLGMCIRKTGRTTGTTYGIITAIDTFETVCTNRECSDYVYFTDCFEMKPASGFKYIGLGGDSGSLITLAETPNPVGLFFAGNEPGDIGIGCKASNVAKLLNITFLEPYTTYTMGFAPSFATAFAIGLLATPRPPPPPKAKPK